MRPSLFKSFSFSWIALALSVLIGFFLSPFVVRHLGPELYGVWCIIGSITSQLIILDFGVRDGLVKYVAQYRTENRPGDLDGIVSSALVLLTGLAIFGFILLGSFTPHLAEWFSISPLILTIATAAFLMSAFEAATEVLSGAFHGALAGSERYDLIYVLNTIRLATSAVLTVLVLWCGAGLVGVACVVLVVRIFYRIALAYFTYRENPSLHLRLAVPILDNIRLLLRYGGWATIIALASRVIYQSDSLVVGTFLGPTEVTKYAVPLILVDQLRMFAQTGGLVLTPRMSSLLAAGDTNGVRGLILTWARVGAFMAIGIGIPLFVTGADFIALWMGAEFRSSSLILYILITPFFFTLPALGFGSYLYATGNHRLNAIVVTVEAVVNLGLFIALAQSLGIRGVAIGTMIPSVVLSGLTLPFITTRSIGMPFGSYLVGSLGRALPLGLFHIATLYTLRASIGTGTWPSFLGVNALAAGILAVVAVVFYLPAEDKNYLRRQIRRALGKSESSGA